VNRFGLSVIFSVVVLTLFGIAQQSPGMYVDQDGALSKLSPAVFSGTEASNHIAKAKVFFVFRGAHSSVQLSTTHPHFRLICGLQDASLIVFCATGPQPSDLIVVRLDEKSDHRDALTATGSMFGGHGGFDPKKTTTASLTKRDDSNWEVSPGNDLAPGEYLLTTGTQARGFDFGIQSGAR